MDYKGQKRADQLYQLIMLIFCIFALLLGHIQQSFNVLFYTWLVGAIVTLIATTPSWPWFNQNPLRWQPLKKKT